MICGPGREHCLKESAADWQSQPDLNMNHTNAKQHKAHDDVRKCEGICYTSKQLSKIISNSINIFVNTAGCLPSKLCLHDEANLPVCCLGGSSGTAHYESALCEHHFCGLDLAICCDTTIHIDLWKNNRLPPRVLRWNHLDSKISKTNGSETDAVICSMIFFVGYQAVTLEYLFTSFMCLYEPNQQEKYKVNLSRQMKRKTWRKKQKLLLILQDGPLPVLNGVITPMSRIMTPVTQL